MRYHTCMSYALFHYFLSTRTSGILIRATGEQVRAEDRGALGRARDRARNASYYGRLYATACTGGRCPSGLEPLSIPYPSLSLPPMSSSTPSDDADELAGDTIIWFGSYKGKRLNELEYSYRLWAVYSEEAQRFEWVSRNSYAARGLADDDCCVCSTHDSLNCIDKICGSRRSLLLRMTARAISSLGGAMGNRFARCMRTRHG